MEQQSNKQEIKDEKELLRKVLKPHEYYVLLSMITFIECRVSWMNILTEHHFLSYDSKMIFKAICENQNLSFMQMMIEVENDGIKNDYLNNEFLEFERKNQLLEEPKNSFDKLIVNKRFRDLKYKIDKINIFEPSEDEIQKIYEDVRDTKSEIEYLTAQNCFYVVAKDLQNGNTELKPRLTGMNEYDDIIGGFTEGMHLIAARAGGGKSSLAAQILAEYAKQNPDRISIFFSAEMGKKAVARRTVSYHSFIDNRKIKAMQLTKLESDKIMYHYAKAPSNSIIIPCNQITVNQARQEIKRIEDEKGLKVGLVCFDYMQKMKPNDKNTRSEVEEFGNISGDVAEFAKEIPTILISNLNKPREGREYSCPTVYDIKGGSMLEFDATSIMMLWKPSADSNIVYSRMLKNRDGENGDETTWRFDGSTSRFNFKTKGIEKQESNNNYNKHGLDPF